jgi:hypothetical protein
MRDEYRLAAAYGRIPVPCTWCGDHFLVWPWEATRKYCSRTCYHAFRTHARKSAACARCGKAFPVEPGQTGRRRFCSRGCYSEAHAPRVPTPAQFWSRVAPGPADDWGCLYWQGGQYNTGYGRIRFAGREELAHRVAFYFTHGRWPTQVAMHVCDRPLCVHPGHLVEGTKSDNLHDMWAKGRARPNQPQGAASPHARLTNAQADAIRVAAGAGERQTALAARYGVSPNVVNRLVRGYTYRER